MGSALSDVRLEARSVLARPNLSVAELLQLKPGDVIPISGPALVPLLVAGRPVALGKIGDQDGLAALKTEKIEGRLKLECSRRTRRTEDSTVGNEWFST